jgi:uncharacterized protein (TIGR02118 family)
MIKVSVMYPSRSDARFDHDYYRTKHLPLIRWSDEKNHRASCRIQHAGAGA